MTIVRGGYVIYFTLHRMGMKGEIVAAMKRCVCVVCVCVCVHHLFVTPSRNDYNISPIVNCKTRYGARDSLSFSLPSACNYSCLFIQAKGMLSWLLR